MRYYLLLSSLLFSPLAFAQSSYSFTPDNPVTASWITSHLRPSPRLLLPPDLESIKASAQDTSSLVGLHYRMLLDDANELLARPVLERKQVGRRMLNVSRDAIRRISTLALVYQVSQEERYLRRMEDELVAVCQFRDWNPSHFLDAAEMAYAVAIGLDWGHDQLADTTRTLAKQALINKALRTSLVKTRNNKRWISSTHNWNQVCHGGLAIAAIVVADEEPALAAQIITRTLDKLPLALEAYSPDGAYPEGASYWFYATYYTAVTISAFESAFGTDFNLTRSPGLLESALFSILTAGPSGYYYNYFDAGATGAFSVEHFDLLTWFATRTTRYQYIDMVAYRKALQQAVDLQEPHHRFAHAGLLWLAQYQPRAMASVLPNATTFRGANPLVILSTPVDNERRFYLGAKGGKADLNHGNMDAGSFIFELDGVRWGLDPGNQNYHQLEQIMGFALWQREQRAQRWTLLTKNNFGHSTLTVNDSLHRVGGAAPLMNLRLRDAQPSVSVDLSKVIGTNVDRAVRTFTQKDDHTLSLTDSIAPNDSTHSVTWNLMTQAEVSVTASGATLIQEGKTLNLTVVQPDSFAVKVVNLSPPPLEYDKHIEGLKRIEVQVPPTALQTAPLVIELRGTQ